MQRKKLYKIERPIYSQEELNKDFEEEQIKSDFLNSLRNKVRCKKKSIKSIFSIFFPLPFILASFYNIKYVFYDFMAGMTMAIFHIPQGLAYGLLAALQPVNGLYASLFPPFIYAFFGTSRHISIGTFSIMSLLSSVPVLREVKMEEMNILNNTFNDSIAQVSFYEMEKLQISMATTLLAGIFQVFLGIFQFGCVISYMSDAFINAFTSAASVHVVMSQMSNLLGYSVPPYSGIGELPYKTYMFITTLNQTNFPTLMVSIACIVILQLFNDYINPPFKKKFKFPIPIQFIIVVLGTAISYFVDLNRRFKVKIVGPIPYGLPSIIIPDITLWNKIFGDAMLLAIIGFVMNCSLVKVYALKFSYNVNYNQEAVAYGLSNVFGSFFQSIMSAAALARTSVVVEIGMKSQVASLISCGFMLLIILFIGPLFTTVPKSVLSAIILVSLTGLLKNITCLPKLWYSSKYDFTVWVVAYISTLFLNVPFGLIFGFIYSLLTVLIHIQNPRSQLLGQLPNTDIYKNIKIFKEAREIVGIKIFRYDAPIYFGNAEHFQRKLYKKTGVNPCGIVCVKNNTAATVKENSLLNEEDDCQKLSVICSRVRFIIIECSSINYIDNVGIRILDDIYKSYRRIDVRVYFTSLNCTLRHMLQKANFGEENRERILFISVHDAVLSTDVYHQSSDDI